jgi:hypothetical protein
LKTHPAALPAKVAESKGILGRLLFALLFVLMPTMYAVATRGERLHHQVEAASHTEGSSATAQEAGAPQNPELKAQPADFKGRPGM